MKKIPTLFVRDDNDRRYVTAEVTPGCEWVLAGEGVATRKYDGTCVRLDEDGRWWARREVKPGKPLPANFAPVHYDTTTGKTMGWEPIGQSSSAKFHADALVANAGHEWSPGTYELIGPKVNGNPESLERHDLRMHALAERILLFDETVPDPDIVDFAQCLRILGEMGWEGVVWHHPDGRMAKLKARDFMRTPPGPGGWSEDQRAAALDDGVIA